MELRFAKLNPTENMTILVETPVPREQQSEIAARLMAYNSVGGEQVGFIEPASLPEVRARLQMMGGEFCGNASLSLAALLFWRDEAERSDITLEVSGYDAPVRCAVERRNGVTWGTVSMPLPERMDTVQGYPAVYFPGIVHLIVPLSAFPSRERAEIFLRQNAGVLGVEAMGLMLMNETASVMTPCVYVRSTDSVVWEHGCDSGTAAVGCVDSAGTGPVRDKPSSARRCYVCLCSRGERENHGTFCYRFCLAGS
ncbi:MAG: hypothetical protein LUH36_08580 [Oscillospiraceae bacterium]|nr:hypothetical protein [Oscillospiraceae bacterium]